jgi:hypothetical protein
MNDLGYVLAILLAALLVLRRGWLKLARQDVVWYTDPVVLFSGAWLIQSVAYALPIFVNRETLEGRHIFYILGCHVAFLVGVMLVPQARPQASDAPASDHLSHDLVRGADRLGGQLLCLL